MIPDLLRSPGAWLTERLAELSRISDDPACLVRTFLSPASHRANRLVAGWMEAAGLTVREDAFGNLTGIREGAPGSGTFVIGSHLDTVIDAGCFDGPAGVLLGIAAAAALPDLPYTLEVAGFSDEEGVRFQTTYLGSRAWAGLITPQELDCRGADGISVRALTAAREAAGFPAMPRAAAPLLGYLEIHIEQGPVLESENLPLAVVSGIAGQTRILAGFSGKAGHAGTTPMTLRRDALPAAAAMVLEAEALARRLPPLLATVGKLEISPGASNVIPCQVRFTLDVRHPDDTSRLTALEHLHAAGQKLALDRGLHWDWEVRQDNRATACDAALTDLLARAVAAGQPRVPRLWSGAGHDAAALAEVCPVALLFVRCRDGLSHHPDEYATPDDLAAAFHATVRFLRSLADPPHD